MPYFNGDLHGFAGKPAAPMTKLYCDVCAETEIPLRPRGTVCDVHAKLPPDIRPMKCDGHRHWETGFKWAPVYGGGENSKCSCCGKPVDSVKCEDVS